MTERMIEANGVELCTEPFGESESPPILLVMGIGASMLWWEEGFCRMLAEGGRVVIRYDHRDTGRSVTYEPGRPRYSGADLVADAAGVLDAYGIPAAHIVGVSAGGAFAQLLERLARGRRSPFGSLAARPSLRRRAADRRLGPSAARLTLAFSVRKIASERLPTSRLSRDLFHALTYEREMTRAGVEVFYALTAGDQTSPEGRLIRHMFQALDQFEVEKLGREVRRGQKENTRQGYLRGALDLLDRAIAGHNLCRQDSRRHMGWTGATRRNDRRSRHVDRSDRPESWHGHRDRIRSRVQAGNGSGVLGPPSLDTWLYAVEPKAGGNPQTDVPEYNVVTRVSL